LYNSLGLKRIVQTELKIVKYIAWSLSSIAWG